LRRHRDLKEISRDLFDGASGLMLIELGTPEILEALDTLPAP